MKQKTEAEKFADEWIGSETWPMKKEYVASLRNAFVAGFLAKQNYYKEGKLEGCLHFVNGEHCLFFALKDCKEKPCGFKR